MIIKESPGRDILRLIIWYPFRWFILLIPPRSSFLTFTLMGKIYYLFARQKKEALRKNLRNVMADKPDLPWKTERVIRRYFENHFISQMQIFVFPRLKEDTVDAVLNIEGLDHVTEALRNGGKGCILIHGHFGPVQLPLCVLGVKGYPMNQVIYRRGENLSPIGEKVQLRLRTLYENKIPARLVSADAFLGTLVRALKENQVVMIAGDGTGHRDVIGKTVRVKLFDRPLRFPVGPLKLAVMTGAALFPAFTIREDGCRFKTVIGRRIEMDSRLARDDQITRGMLYFTSLLEDWIRKYPDHWHFWDNFRKGALIVDEPHG